MYKEAISGFIEISPNHFSKTGAVYLFYAFPYSFSTMVVILFAAVSLA